MRIMAKPPADILSDRTGIDPRILTLAESIPAFSSESPEEIQKCPEALQIFTQGSERTSAPFPKFVIHSGSL
jgi:hypothetical protein